MYYWLFLVVRCGAVEEVKAPLTLYTIEEAFRYADSVSGETGRYTFIGMINEKGVIVK